MMSIKYILCWHTGVLQPNIIRGCPGLGWKLCDVGLDVPTKDGNNIIW